MSRKISPIEKHFENLCNALNKANGRLIPMRTFRKINRAGLSEVESQIATAQAELDAIRKLLR